MTFTNVLCAPAGDSCDHAQCAYRLLALVALNAARAEMERIALASDTPRPGDVDAADHLDAAHALLTQVSP